MEILHIVGSMNMGGQETYIMNLMRNIDRNKYHFSFLEYGEEDYYYDREIKKLGGNIFRIVAKKDNFFLNIFQTFLLLKKEKFDIVEIHSSVTTSFMYLLICKLCNIKKRMIHCHSTIPQEKLYHNFFRRLMNSLSTDRLACSYDAGNSLFKKKEYIVIRNGIDFNKFLYKEERRQLLRKKYKCTDDIVYINIGRLCSVKNQLFLVDIFSEIVKENQKSKLLIIGEGELEQEINSQIEKYGLNEKFIHVKSTNNIEDYMSFSDILISTSFFEGFGMVIAEGQAIGLKCIVSDSVPREIKFTNNIEFIPLNESSKYWANIILNVVKNHYRISYYDYNYSIQKTIDDVITIYNK